MKETAQLNGFPHLVEAKGTVEASTCRGRHEIDVLPIFCSQLETMLDEHLANTTALLGGVGGKKHEVWYRNLYSARV